MKSDLVPMRWPVGWKDPARLELIQGTPINCLVGEAPPPFPLGDIQFVPEGTAPDGVALHEGRWPKVEGGRDPDTDTADAGATGAPWVDSNAAVIRLARALEPEKMVWLTYSPPPATEVVPFAQSAVPVAEAGAYGARWVIGLQDPLREAIERQSAEAIGAWKQMVAMLEFFSRHAEWRDWDPVARLAVVSSFEGEHAFLAEEFLNLAPRGHLAYRIIPKASAMEASLEGLRAVLLIDDNAGTTGLGEKLLAFAAAGGLLIAPSPMPGTGAPTETKLGYNIYRWKQGTIAAPQVPWADPYLLVQEVHLLVSHRYDVVRIWNAGPMNTLYVAPPAGGRGVVHLVKYGGSARRRGELTLGLSEEYAKARILTPEGEQDLEPVKSRLGIEIPLPSFGVYAAVELG